MTKYYMKLLLWHKFDNGFFEHLYLLYKNKKRLRIIQLTIFLSSDPVLVDTGMSAVGCQWSHDGSILAVAGTMTVAGAAEKDSNVVQVLSLILIKYRINKKLI